MFDTPPDEIDLHRLAEMITREKQASYHWRAVANETEDPIERRRLERQAREASRHERRLTLQVAVLFGQARGWRLTDRYFDLLTLARGKMHSGGWYDSSWAAGHDVGWHHSEMDHPQFYRAGGYAAAIVAHNYNPDRGPSAELARRHGLVFETPDIPSWYLPDGTWLAVYIGPRGLLK